MFKIGQTVKFGQGDDANTELTGVISRVWGSGHTVTIKVEGTIAGTVRTFVRDTATVKPA